MNTAEIIDKLCSITEEQSRIIREQFLFIRNCLAVDQSILEHFEGMIKPVEDALDLAEYSLRRDRNTVDGTDLKMHSQFLNKSASTDHRCAFIYSPYPEV